MTTTCLEWIRTTAFRNLAAQPFHFEPATSLVVGDNGQGKTNLLEAIAFLGNLRSFRRSGPRRMVCHGSGSFALEAQVRAAGFTTRLRVVCEMGPPVQRHLLVNGQSTNVADYLRHLPVAALSLHDRELVVGEPRIRRAYLDRLAFHLEPAMYDDLRTYERSRRQRNAVLAAGGPDAELEAWEQPLARAAARVVRRRLATVERVTAILPGVVSELTTPAFPPIDVSYRGDAVVRDAAATDHLEEMYRTRYNAERARDREAGFTLEGPHRHDLALRTDGKPVRDVLSSGQTKITASALRLTALATIEETHKRSSVVVVDDVDAELDPSTLGRVVAHLTGTRQVVLSTAREHVVRTVVPDGRVIRLAGGHRVPDEG